MRPLYLLLIAVSAVAVLGLTIAVRQPSRSSVAAQELTKDGPPGLTVVAMGQAHGQPDQATLQLGVTSEHPTAAVALEQANAGAQAVLAKLDELGIPRSQVQTSAVNLFPIRERSDQQPNPNARDQPGATERITGYRATNALTVRLTDISRVGEVVDGAVAAGANQVLGIEFGLRDPSWLRIDALQDAVQDARTKAQAIADPLGLQVGQVIDVQEIRGQDRGQPGTAYQPAAASTPIEPGQLQVQAQVEVTFDVAPTSS